MERDDAEFPALELDWQRGRLDPIAQHHIVVDHDVADTFDRGYWNTLAAQIFIRVR